MHGHCRSCGGTFLCGFHEEDSDFPEEGFDDDVPDWPELIKAITWQQWMHGHCRSCSGTFLYGFHEEGSDFPEEGFDDDVPDSPLDRF